MTISYFANVNLVTNSTASPLANVTYTTNRNIYSYEPGQLWKAYGIGIGVAVLCALIGFRAMLVDGAPFKNSWSTIFLATRDPQLTSLFNGSDDHMAGAEPVPALIKRATMVYTRSGFHLRDRGNGFEPLFRVEMNPDWTREGRMKAFRLIIQQVRPMRMTTSRSLAMSSGETSA